MPSKSKKCHTRVLSKSVLQEGQVRVSSKKCLTRVSSKSIVEECQAGVSHKSVKSERQARVSYQRSAIVSSKGVLQECHLSVSSQGVPQVGSLEKLWQISIISYSTYVSAFGFRGFHLVLEQLDFRTLQHFWEDILDNLWILSDRQFGHPKMHI